MKNGEFMGISPSKLFFWWEFRKKHADFTEKDGEPMLVGGLEHGNVTLPRNMVLEWDLKLAIICD